MKTKENKSIFLQHFGDTPQLRVMDFFIENHFFDYPLTEIARGANVSYNSLKVFFDSWVKSNVLIKTRRVGKSGYFKLNLNNNFVRNLIKLDWALIKGTVLSQPEREVEA